jgi:hypothetical protein
MRVWIACLFALVAVSACGNSQKAKDALAMMNLEDGGSGYVEFAKYEGFFEKATFKDVTIKFGEGRDAPSVHIDEMVFDGLDTSEDGAVFKSLVMTGVTPELPEGVMPGLDLHVDRIALMNPNEEMANTVSQVFEWLGDPDDEHSRPDEPKIQEWQFGQLLVAGFSAKGLVSGEGARANIDLHVNEVSMNDARSLRPEDPQFGRFLVSNVALKADSFASDQGGVEGRGEFNLAEFSINDLRHFSQDQREVGRVFLGGLSIRGEGAADQGRGSFEGSLREVSLTDVKALTARRQEFGQFMFAGLAFKAEGGAQGQKAHAEGGIGEISLAGLRAASMEQIEFQQFKVAAINANGWYEDGTGPRSTASVELGELSGANVNESKIGAITLSGFKGAFDAPEPNAPASRLRGDFDFGALNVSNFNLGLYARLVRAEMNSIRGTGSQSLAQAIGGLSSPIEPGYDGFTWSGMNASVGGMKLTSSRVEVKVERNPAGAATRVSSAPVSIAFTVDPAGSAAAREVSQQLAAIGLTNAELHASGDLRYDPTSDLTGLSTFTIGSNGIAEMTMSGRMTGITRAVAVMLAPSNTPADRAALQNARIIAFDVSVTDKTLLDLIFRAAAASDGDAGPSVAQLRAETAQQLRASRTDLESGGMDAALAREFSGAMADFIEMPGTLRVRIDPPEPLTLAMLDGSAPLSKRTLGFSAVFTPAGAPVPASTPAPAPAQH